MLPYAQANIDFRKNGSIEDDKYLWCEDCKMLVVPPCSTHGELTVVKDRVIPSRAKLSLPHHLAIRCIEMRAGNEDVYGVYARKVIQARTQFGPYEGKLTETWACKRDDRIELKLFFPNGSFMYLDCTDESICNWMMFVRPATSTQEQNMVVFQYNGAVYFVTTRPVAPNEELKVWYASHYAQKVARPLLSEKNVCTAVQVDQGDSCSDELQDGSHSALQELQNTISKPCSSVKEQNLHGDMQTPQAASDQHIGDSISDDDHDGDFIIETGSPVQNASKEDTSHSISIQEVSVSEEISEGLNIVDNSENSSDQGRRTKNKRKGQPTRLKETKHIKVTIKLNPTETSSQTVVKEEDDQSNISPAPPERGRGRPKGSKNKKGFKLGGFVKQSVKKARRLLGRDKDVKGEKTYPQKRGRKPKATKQLHICEVCGKAFHHSSKLQLHSYLHSGERPFVCTVENCNKTFISKFKLDRHMLVHNALKKFSCAYCDKSFGRKDHLKNHLKVHDPNKQMLHCEECGKEYASSYAFRTHLSLHAAHRGELQCRVCKANFEMTEDLLHHLKIHSGARSVKDSSQKKHKCSICDKSFFTKKDVGRHMVTHTKSRDHMCHLCPQSFGRRDHLVRHLKTSHGKDAKAPSKSKQPSKKKTTLSDTLNYDPMKVADVVMQSVDKYMKSDISMKERIADKETSVKQDKIDSMNVLEKSDISVYNAISDNALQISGQTTNNELDTNFLLHQQQTASDHVMSTIESQVISSQMDQGYINNAKNNIFVSNHELGNQHQQLISSQPLIQQSPVMFNVAKQPVRVNTLTNYAEPLPSTAAPIIDLQDAPLLLSYPDGLGFKLVGQNMMQPPSSS